MYNMRRLVALPRLLGLCATARGSRGCSSASSPPTPPHHPFSLMDVMGDSSNNSADAVRYDEAGNETGSAMPFASRPPFPLPDAYRRAGGGYRASHGQRTADFVKELYASSPAAATATAEPMGGQEGREAREVHTTGQDHPSPSFPSSSKAAHGTPEDIRRAVREAVLKPLGEQPGPHVRSSSGGGRTRESSSGSSSTEDGADGGVSSSPSVSVYPLTVRIADKFGMPAELPRGSPKTFADLMDMCPSSILKDQLRHWLDRNRIHTLTQAQLAVMPFVLEYRDVLCIAPTATGKTFAYVFPTMLRLAMDEAAGLQNPTTSVVSANGDDGEEEEETATAFRRRDVEALLKEKINKGEVCRYCELSIAENPLCPMTGVPHPPPPSETDMPLNTTSRRAVRLEELSTTAEPRVLILVPTSQLAFQVYNVCRRFHADYNIRYMVRGSSAEEQRRFLQALEGTDVLVSTPETILPAMYKQKLSLRRVKTLILDEIDDLVSVNHFEKLKIILGALPKGVERPQRLLFGASLPPVAYNMLKERMLLPSHRFVLADVATDHLGHPVAQTPATQQVAGSADVARGASKSVLTTPSNSAITHVVFMVGRIEKMQKLAWLYETGRLTFDQRTIIFCNSRNNVAYVHDRLRTLVPEIRVTTLTSRASVTAREGVLRMFATGVSTCLVATDLLSRGIDFKGVMYVVHYDMPLEMETWVHRNGRCGRSGLPGYVYTFFQPENIKMAKPLVAYLRQNKQLVPPKLQEYAKQPFVELFKRSNFHHPTRPYRRDDPQNTTPVLGRGSPRFPDYRQEGIHKNFRPL